jgi:hypothetical protein
MIVRNGIKLVLTKVVSISLNLMMEHHFNGTAGNSLAWHNTMKFPTKVVLIVLFSLHSTGAWWYNGCQHSNLNGQYLVGDVIYTHNKPRNRGVIWEKWKYDSLKFSEMKVRRN